MPKNHINIKSWKEKKRSKQIKPNQESEVKIYFSTPKRKSNQECEVKIYFSTHKNHKNLGRKKKKQDFVKCPVIVLRS